MKKSMKQKKIKMQSKLNKDIPQSKQRVTNGIIQEIEDSHRELQFFGIFTLLVTFALSVFVDNVTSQAPTKSPSHKPSTYPSAKPTSKPSDSIVPSISKSPVKSNTSRPSRSQNPSNAPSVMPNAQPSMQPSNFISNYFDFIGFLVFLIDLFFGAMYNWTGNVSENESSGK